MIGVDLIGEIRRAYFEQQRPIKEIVRTLSVSRATVRKVIRSRETAFKYERGVQAVPKLGEWVEVLTGIVEKEATRPRRERLAGRAGPGSGPGVRADELCARRDVPVRLEPRDDHAPGSAADGQGGTHEAVAQPDAVGTRCLRHLRRKQESWQV
jgi:hypothetical protein